MTAAAPPRLFGAALALGDDNLVLSQRLLRKLCLHCRKPIEASPKVLERLGDLVTSDVCFYEAGSCDRCNQTGYRGRIPVTEVMSIDPGMRALIAERADTVVLQKHAREQCGMVALHDDALRKAAQGMTSIEEVFRMTK